MAWPTTIPTTYLDADSDSAALARPAIYSTTQAINVLIDNQCPTVGPIAYGAVGNGVTDDTVALQNTLNAAGAIATAGGKYVNVNLLGKNYLISDTLDFPSNVRLHNGALVASASWFPDTKPMIYLDATTRGIIEYVQLDCKKLAAGINVFDSTGIYLHVVRLFNFKTYGIQSDGNTAVSRCTIQQWLPTDAEFTDPLEYTADGIKWLGLDSQVDDHTVVAYCGCCMRIASRNDGILIVNHVHFFNGGAGKWTPINPKNIIFEGNEQQLPGSPRAGQLVVTSSYLDNGDIDLYSDKAIFSNNVVVAANSSSSYVIKLFPGDVGDQPNMFRSYGWLIRDNNIQNGTRKLIAFDGYDSAVAPFGTYTGTKGYTWLSDFTAIYNYATTVGYDQDIMVTSGLQIVKTRNGTTAPMLALNSPGASGSCSIAMRDSTSNAATPPVINVTGNELNLYSSNVKMLQVWNDGASINRIAPGTTKLTNLGSSTLQWKLIYGQQFIGYRSPSILIDGPPVISWYTVPSNGTPGANQTIGLTAGGLVTNHDRFLINNSAATNLINTDVDGDDGQVIYIYVTDNRLTTIKHADLDKRFYNTSGADILILQNHVYCYIYDRAARRWRQVGIV